jgi:aminopeptidase N
MKTLRFFLLICIIPACTSLSGERFFEEGVSDVLARYRKNLIDSVVYNLDFSIPESQSEIISGSARIDFSIDKPGRMPLLLDFNAPGDHLHELRVNGKETVALHQAGHIVIPREKLVKGVNNVELKFRAGDQSLNRNPGYLYTLFVPDRASTAFPCFDQPDIKAKYVLTLSIPENWQAISNNPALSEIIRDSIKVITFGDGPPLSTYLFAFAAGRFERVVRVIDGVEMEMLHREPQAFVVERNIDEIFNLHYNSIKWMEDYSGIPYPFRKFGFVLIPSFQYGGMEHPGAIFYRASSLFLEPSPTVNEQMSRASLIAHETSHIWFGDLVTMKWFDDVWLKEVFAGYISDKIVNPAFPQINHDLRFLLSRYPAAYAVDRTTGTNPVIQELDNLRNAGSLYGGIIYNKAPVIMKHLEQMTGDSILRESLRIYLKEFSYGNAEWDDLTGIIEEVSGMDLKRWSHAWAREAGMPEINTVTDKRKDGYHIHFIERDPRGKNRHWPQVLHPLIITGNETVEGRLVPRSENPVIVTTTAPLCIVPDKTGTGYGYFKMDRTTVNYFTEGGKFPDNPLLKGVMWLNLNENVLNQNVAPETMYKALLRSLETEGDELLLNHLIGRTGSAYWNYLSSDQRAKWAAETERLVWGKAVNERATGMKRTWFNLFKNISTTEDGIGKLYEVWNRGEFGKELKLSEDDMCSLSLVIAMKGHKAGKEMVAAQLAKIVNDDRRSRYLFVLPAVDADLNVRDEFFNSLAKPENREREPWVLEALGYLHHPLNSEYSVKYIRPSLNLLEEIKYTGDIFFPAGWISTILGGHSSAAALSEVEGFLSDHPDYPEDLKLKILQAADHLFRFADPEQHKNQDK